MEYNISVSYQYWYFCIVIEQTLDTFNSVSLVVSVPELPNNINILNIIAFSELLKCYTNQCSFIKYDSSLGILGLIIVMLSIALAVVSTLFILSHRKRKSKAIFQSSKRFLTGNAMYENMEHTDDTNVVSHTTSHHNDYDYIKEQAETANENMLDYAVVSIDKTPVYDILQSQNCHDEELLVNAVIPIDKNPAYDIVQSHNCNDN